MAQTTEHTLQYKIGCFIISHKYSLHHIFEQVLRDRAMHLKRQVYREIMKAMYKGAVVG